MPELIFDEVLLGAFYTHFKWLPRHSPFSLHLCFHCITEAHVLMCLPNKLQKGVDFDNLVGPQIQLRLRLADKGKGDRALWWDAGK